jgi:hypothetical protein
MEPNENIHYIYDTYEEASDAYSKLSEKEKEQTEPPRQSHGCWIFDKINE